MGFGCLEVSASLDLCTSVHHLAQKGQGKESYTGAHSRVSATVHGQCTVIGVKCLLGSRSVRITEI